jgi:hypothetical protein
MSVSNFVFEQYLSAVVVISILFIAIASINIDDINKVESGAKKISDIIVRITNALGLSNAKPDETPLYRYINMRKDICGVLIAVSALTILLSVTLSSRQYTLISFPIQVIIYMLYENASYF